VPLTGRSPVTPDGTKRILWTAGYPRLAKYVLARDGYQCQIRGPKCRGWADTVDHVIARADGGSVFDPGNLRAASRVCNSGRFAERTNARAAKYRMSLPTNETRP
jgi:5-methylcytosine-specific restriction protein A